MITTDKITQIFCLVDDFCKEFDKTLENHSLTHKNGKRKRHRKQKLSQSEVITIMILFHRSGYRNLKRFYLESVQVHPRKEFPQTVSYNRFVELQKQSMVVMCVFLKPVV